MKTLMTRRNDEGLADLAERRFGAFDRLTVSRDDIHILPECMRAIRR